MEKFIAINTYVKKRNITNKQLNSTPQGTRKQRTKCIMKETEKLRAELKTRKTIEKK